MIIGTFNSAEGFALDPAALSAPSGARSTTVSRTDEPQLGRNRGGNMTKAQKINAIVSGITDAWERQSPQAAANVIANAGDLQSVAMDAAAAAGFIPEYYPNAVRVYLPE